MKHGHATPVMQYPPTWRHSAGLTDKMVSRYERMLREKHVGNCSPFEYCVGMNLVVLTGKVTRAPRLSGSKRTKQTWFRICVPNQDNPDMKLFLSVRCKNEVGLNVAENLRMGDVVAIVGRMFTRRMPKHDLVYCLAERVSSPYPVALDSDPQFVRVRWDLWNRIAAIVGKQELMALPPRKRAELLALFAKQGGLVEDPPEEAGDDRHNPESP